MSKRVDRLINAVIDLFAIVIDNAPRRISEERLSQLLGSNPVLPQLLGTPRSQPETPRSHIATPEGVSEEHYCLDCMSKHLGTAKILIREALQRADANESKEAILGKVRGAYEELMGAEDDSQALKDERIRALNSQTRELRKWFFDNGVLVDTDKAKIAEAMNRISALNDAVYQELEARRERLKEFIGKAKKRLNELEEKLNAESRSASTVR
jgi:hypothetical protein